MKCALRDLNQQTPFLLGTFKQNVGCGGKNLEFQNVMALLICLKNAFQVGVRFALGLGWELWLLVMRVVQITPSCLS